MDNGFSILMFLFSGALLLYSALLAVTKDYSLIPRSSAVSVKEGDKKRYTLRLAKVIALVALSPALSAIVAFWNLRLGIASLAVSTALLIRAGVAMMEEMK